MRSLDTEIAVGIAALNGPVFPTLSLQDAQIHFTLPSPCPETGPEAVDPCKVSFTCQSSLSPL
jgi:hypothetical protein